MSNSGASKVQLLQITGNPTVDTAIRAGLIGLCGLVTGIVVGWLNAHGFKDPNLSVYVGTGVSSFLGVMAVAIWGIIRSSKIEAIIQLREAIGVQAGMNLAAAGQMEVIVDPEGKEIPKPVTVDSAKQIIADHATPVTK